MKKLLSLVLVCALFATLITGFSVSAAESFNVTSYATSVNVPDGKIVTVNADAIAAGAEKFVLYKSADGIAKGEKAGEAAIADGKASVQVVLSTDDSFYVAEALDANGNVVADGNAIKIKGSFERLSEMSWNLDFSSHSIGAHRWGAPYVQLNDNATGSAAYCGSNYFTAHTGSAANTIETADTGDAAHGVAIRMTAADSAEVQFNEFFTRISGSVIKWEEDFKIDSLPSNGIEGTINAIQPVLGNGAWVTTLGVQTNGESVYFRSSGDTLDMEVGKWYNLVCYTDLENNVYAYYIDDVLFSVGSIKEGATSAEKFAPRLKNAPGASIWFDNIKISAVSVNPDGLGFDLVAGTASANISGGKKVLLTASNLPEGVTSVEFFRANDEGEAVSSVGTAVADGTTASFAATVANGTNTFVAKCYNEKGSAIGKSNKVSFWGYYESIVDTRWDVDFEDEYAGAHRWGYPYVSIYGATGTALVSGGDDLTAHCGTTANMIATEPVDDAHGKALKLFAADNAEVQLNEFKSSHTGEVIAFEWDYMLDTLPNADGATITVMQPVLAGGNWQAMIQIKVSGGDINFECGGSSIPAKLDTWYNIKAYADLVGGKYIVYVDDTLLYAQSINKGFTGGQKVVSKLMNAAGATAWIDNFKTYSLSITEDVPPVSVTLDVAADLIGGKAYTFVAGTLPDATSEIVWYFADANGNKVKKIGTTNDSKYDIELGYGQNYIIAEAVDADGAIVSVSDVFEVSAKYESVTDLRWDIDFEDEYAGAHRWGPPYVSIYGANGGVLTSSGDTLTAHTATADNAITTDMALDASHGKALKFEARDGGQVQLNEFLASPLGDVIKYEIDYMIDVLPNTGSDATIQVIQPVLAGGNWATALYAIVSGDGFEFVAAGATMKASVDTWYTITAYANLKAATITYYINNKYFAVSSIPADLAGGQKVVSLIKNAQGTVLWIDNFEVSALTFADPTLSFNVNYDIDGASADAVKAGALTVNADVTNDGNARGVTCIAAVYNGNELVKVKIASHNFENGEFGYAFDAMDMGTLSGSETVKVMLWKADSTTPLFVASELK